MTTNLAHKKRPPKGFCFPIRTGLRRKVYLHPTNADLYHYAGNCPVRYIDPDGKKIIVDGDTENLNTILELINSLSETQYKYKENNELEIDNTKINRRGSSIYSNAINSLINDGTTTIQIANTYKDENGNQIPIPKSTDGTPMPGYTYGSNAAKIMNVSITGCSGAIIPTVAEFAQEASPAEVLMHELAGHANPRIRGIVGNAVAIDNSIRCELLLRSGGVAPKLRMPDEKHGTHRIINK